MWEDKERNLRFLKLPDANSLCFINLLTIGVVRQLIH